MIRIFPAILQGTVTAPPSKSASIRALVADYLAGGGSVLHNLSDCSDVLAAQSVLERLRSCSDKDDNELSLPCNESALTLHLTAPAAALHARPVLFTAQGSLLQRPLESLSHALEAFGARCCVAASGFPFRVAGPLQAGKKSLDGRFGSQAVSGLLMALPLLAHDSKLTLLQPVSRPYIDLTLEVMHRFGVHVDAIPIPQSAGFNYLIQGGQHYRPTEFTIPGDWSGAAALMAAIAVSGAKHQGAGCRVMGIGVVDQAVPDSVIIEVLQSAGVTCTLLAEGWEISVSGGLRPFTFDLTHAPDLAPVLIALADHIHGVSILTGAGRLIHKESSRGEVLQQIFKQCGIHIDLSADELIIHGGEVRAPDEALESHNDHRIAMAIAVAAVGADHPIRLSGASCVAKTYPRFWDDLASLGLRIEKIA
jgi:3-phosphoshikimate 1-carboxyvinyltransferase